jgi:hypothetical protein
MSDTINLEQIFGSINKNNRNSRAIRAMFYAKLQFLLKMQLPVTADAVLLWPQIVPDFLKSKKHQPSSIPPTHGYIVPEKLFIVQ